MRNCLLVVVSVVLTSCFCLSATGGSSAKRSSPAVPLAGPRLRSKTLHRTAGKATAAAANSAQHYGDIPLAFEPNQGQAPGDVRFVSRAEGMTVLLKEKSADLIVTSLDRLQSSVHMEFVGAEFREQPVASGEQGGVSNYLLGDSPAQWHTDVPNFSRVRYGGVYPGVDLVMYGNRRRLEHDFVVAPGANYRQIRVRLEGATHLSLGDQGGLQVETGSGKFTFKAPDIYQDRDGKRISVRGHYTLLASNEFAFEVGGFDHRLPLVIDPVLSYSTYLAGSSVDTGTGVAIDSNGYAYVTGYTASIDFPTQNPEQGTCANICDQGDVFVTKLNTTGTGLVYSTFVGGSAYDRSNAIAVDSQGYVSVAGNTQSFNFPQKNGMTVVLSANSMHGFVFGLNPAGSALTFSTYLGGESSDAATGIAADPAGNVYVSGITSSTFFPVTAGNQIGPAPNNSSSDLFLAKFARTGTLAYSALIGGSTLSFPGTFGYPSQTPFAVAVNSAGEAILSGTASDGVPTTPGAYKPDYPGMTTGAGSAFLLKLNAAGTAVVYGTYLSSASGSQASGLALDSTGNVYITGSTTATDFPTTAGSFQPENLQGSYPGLSFVAKLDPTLSSLIYSTYLGGTQSGSYGGVTAAGIAVDSHGNAHVAGFTNQIYFPLVSPVIGTLAQNIYGNVIQGFLSVLNPSGSALVFSTYFGGSTSTSPLAVAVGPAGNPYITGTTSDSDLPTTAGAFQRKWPDPPYLQHAFVSKFVMTTANAAACLQSGALYFGTVQSGQSSPDIALTLTNCGTIPLKVNSVTVTNSSFVVSQNGCNSVAAGANCMIKVHYSPVVVNGTDTGLLKINDNAPISPQTVQLIGFSAVPAIQLYNTEVVTPDGVVGAKGFPVPVQVINPSVLPLRISKVTATGDFSVDNQCLTDLYQGSTCYLLVTFTPKAAGTRTGVLSIYDNVPGSPQTLPLKGTGLAKYPVPIINYLSPGAAPVGSGAVSLYIGGTNFYPASKVTLNGTAVPVTSPSSDWLQATIPASMLTTVNNLAVQVVNPAPGGGASNAFNFAVYKQIPLGASDVIFEPFTRKFYASIPATAATNPNSLVTIDPVTYVVGPPIAIGNDPGALGLSADGTILYVGLNGNNSILPFNLVTQKAGVGIPLGSDPLKGPLTATNIQVQPDHPANIVATLATPNGAGGLDWIKDGRVVTQFLNEPPTNETIGGAQFVGSNDIYGWSGYYNASGIEHFVVTGNNLLKAPGFGGDYGIGPFDNDGKNLYDVNGQVFVASTGALLGSLGNVSGFTFNSAILTEHNSGRTFVLGQSGDISVYDSTTLALVGTTTFSDYSYHPNRLQHWGANGLSLLKSNNYNLTDNDLVLFRSSWLYPSVGPNPVPVLTAVSPSPVISKGSNFLLTVTGSKFTRGAVVQWNGVTRTTKWISDTKLVADIQASEIKAAGTAKITVVNPGPGGGPSGVLSLTVK